VALGANFNSAAISAMTAGNFGAGVTTVPGGPPRPQPVFNTSPLLAQGFNVGVRYNY
jgi:hypothetical protein